MLNKRYALTLVRLTGAGENDVVDASVEGLHSLDGDLRVVDVFGDEARAVSDGQHGVLQQRMVLHKLQRLIGQLERRGDVLHAVQVVDALKYINQHPIILKFCDIISISSE